MPSKPYKPSKAVPLTLAEPAVAYETAVPEVSSSGRWNPNVPFHGTQEEWWEHFHRIEEGNFTPLEEANREFELWRKKYLASRLK